MSASFRRRATPWSPSWCSDRRGRSAASSWPSVYATATPVGLDPLNSATWSKGPIGIIARCPAVKKGRSGRRLWKEDLKHPSLIRQFTVVKRDEARTLLVCDGRRRSWRGGHAGKVHHRQPGH